MEPSRVKRVSTLGLSLIKIVDRDDVSGRDTVWQNLSNGIHVIL